MGLKRGFLNTEKGRASLSLEDPPVNEAAKVNHLKAELSSEGKAPATAANDAVAPQVAATSSVEPKSDSTLKTDAGYSNCTCGKGATKSKETPLDLHVAPGGLGQDRDRNRFIFRVWPRALDGEVIRGDHAEHGKMTSNGCQIWGDTLYDLFMTTRIPGRHNLRTFTSGSLMRAHMLKFGELHAAADELDWAASEPEPKQLQPFDIGKLIRDADNRTGGRYHMDSMLNSLLPTLQSRLPFHLLPEKLIVHDPWNTLSISKTHRDSNTAWSEKDDIVHAYKLSLSPEGKVKVKEDREAAQKVEAERVEKEKDEWRVLNPSRTSDGTMSNNYAIHAKVPSRLPKPKSIPEAHLYIRRVDRAGTGNHSVVYTAQLELPRWALADDVLCERCWGAAFEKEMDERVAAGTLLSDEEKAKTPELKVVTKIVNPRAEVVLVEEEAHGKDCREARNGPSDIKYDRGYCMERVTEQLQTAEFSGPTAYIYPKIEWQRPGVTPPCEHLRILGSKDEEIPATARVRVCAKMSIQHDAHLKREAVNYQKFPDWFFEHWSGYNVVRPLHDPTPCGAIVPQFYGYYVPEKPAHGKDDYLSPLLLLEHCGKEIEVDELSQDERNEAAALYFHFLDGGWTQGSIAPRNILCQPGPNTASPLERMARRPRQRCFRLIDFGRALELSGEGSRYCLDKDEVFRLFKLAHYAE
ncbi:unnamed protein product [Peniophora sp. CBMAI 1063]|nr:unnamed protein product [Peniophora sp. CBMAI 1063]